MARRGLLLALLALTFVAAPAWSAPPAPGGLAAGWKVALSIASTDAGSAKMFEAFDTASLNLYDVDGDGRVEIVTGNDNNRVYVIDPRAGRVLAELETYHYNIPRWPVRELNPVAIGDLYGDGAPCLVVPNSASFLAAFCYDAAASSPSRFTFEKRWQVRVDAAAHEPDFRETHPYLYHPNGTAKYPVGMDGPAYLADVTGDGKLEVFVETDSWPGQLSYSHDGKYRWSRSFADGNAGAVVRDVDKDGQKEAIFFSDGGLVSVHDARTGGVEWVFDATDHGATPGSIPVPGLVKDLDGDGRHEIVFGARHAVETDDPDWINRSHARYFALDYRGRMIWEASYDWMNPLQYQHPAPADVNGDGVLDIVFLDWNTIGHKPGDWQTTNRKSNLFALDGRDGRELWHRGITVYWSNKDVVILDVDGDGDAEVVAPTAKGGSEGLGLYDLRTGEDRGWMPLGDGWSMTRGPVAGDLDGDGRVELVVPFNRAAPGTNYRSLDVGWREGRLLVVETGASVKGIVFSANLLHNDALDTGREPRRPVPSPAPAARSTPLASFVVETDGLIVRADASASSAADGNLTRYAWSWGDGAVAEGRTARHAYARAGSYTVTLTVTDEDGRHATRARTTTVAAQPTPTPAVEPTPSPLPAPSSPARGEVAAIPEGGAALVLVGALAAALRRAQPRR